MLGWSARARGRVGGHKPSLTPAQIKHARELYAGGGKTGRATGERLCRQRGRLAPQAPALRTSHSRAWSPPYDRGQQSSARACRCPGQGWPFPGRCHPAAGAAAGPGGAPAAQRGRTTCRCGKTTATLGREEGQGSRIAGKTTAPEGHLRSREDDRRKPLTQRGFRYARHPVHDRRARSPTDLAGLVFIRLFEVNRDGVSGRLPGVFSWRLRCVMGVLCRGCRQCGRACADLPGYGIRMPGGPRVWRAGSGFRRSRS